MRLHVLGGGEDLEGESQLSESFLGHQLTSKQ